MALGTEAGCRAKPKSKGRGCGAGRDVEDRMLRLGRMVPAEDAADQTHLALAAVGREWGAAGDAGLTAPKVRERASAEQPDRAVVFRVQMYVRIARVRGRDLSCNAGP